MNSESDDKKGFFTQIDIKAYNGVNDVSKKCFLLQKLAA